MSNGIALPADVSPHIPSPARIYDYYLGGKDNFAADRTAAEKALSVVPQGRDVARSNRRFLVRTVRYMASRGVSQFIDLGTGFPTPPSVHETAAAVLAGRPQVVYIDNDPMVTSHNRALLADSRASIAVIHADIRCPGQIFASEQLWRTIDFGQPVGVLFVAVLHFIPAEDDPRDSVRAFCSQMAPGSFLAISHITSDGTAPAVMAAIKDAYRTASAPAVFRSTAEIEGLFAGLEVVHPGITEVSAWRASERQLQARPPALRVLGGVGRKQ
jgi:hypothetical protein